MSIYRVIDKLEAYVREGTVLPLKYRILSEERLMEFIEKMRATLPEEVGRAKIIASNKERIVREAQEKAQAIVSEASTAHEQLIDQSEIVRQARTTAEIVLREAEERAEKIRAGADAYAAQVLAELDARLTTALASVKKGIDALGGPKGAQLADAVAKSKRAAIDRREQQAPNDTQELESIEVPS
jgi:vacuolar-type H+-ATPase subunit H